MMYDDIATGYDELHGEEQKKKILRVKHLLDGKKVLDIGAGTGILADYINAEVHGVEPSKEMIKQSKNRNITMIQGKAEDTLLALEKNTYTACASFTAFHHITNPILVFEQIQRVCVNDATIVLSFLDTTPTETIHIFKEYFTTVNTYNVQRDTVHVATNNYLK